MVKPPNYLFFTDAAGQQTLSTYDLAGRRTQLIHPDAGKSTYKFDAAGNLLERQTANLEAVNKKITYEYDYNRLTKIHYPLHPENDVRYVYGTQNEGNNRRGKLILQEDATGAQEFSYGITGEIEKVRRTLIAPNNAVATYVTQWKYDSWNRVQEMIYPDEEKITYDYNSGGLLQAIKGYKSYSYNYVNKLGYDKFEQRTYLKYCNGTETKYNYEPLRRRLDVMTVASGTGYQGTTTPRTFMNNKYVYDNVSNVLSVTNSAAGVASKMGGTMKHTYQYDNLYRLTGATGIYTGADQKTGKYDLAMSYDNLHNIVSKVQNVTQNKVTETSGLSAGYNLTYNYDSTKKHQLKNINETEYRDKVTPKPATPSNKNKDNKYTYDANGNQIYVNTVQEKLDGSQDNKALEKTMLWDEENRLGAISINGYVSSYTYDASGERVSKLSGGGQGIFVNSAFSGGKTATSDFTLYTSPYLVAQSGGRYTKHIYVGSQRIVSKLGDFDSYGADPRRIEKAGDSFNGVKVDYASKYKSALNVVKANYETLKVPYYGLDNDDYVNGLGFCCNPASSSTSPTAKSANSKNDNAELQQYYYHPDHLGSSSYISNLDGEVVQHVEYVPFGEVFLEEKNAVWNTPYLFNGKELDKETGLSYYGARYYEAKTSLWISVDPLAEKYPNFSGFAYCFNNPIRFIDPSGMEGESASSPIYGRNGELLGTDDQGLQGKAIIMDEKNFKQGMKHEDAMKKDLAPNGGSEYYKAISDYGDYSNFYKHYNSLSTRPDYDGVVEDWEARKHWNENSGSPLYVDVSKLNLKPLTTKSFEDSNNGRLQYNFFTSLSSDTRTSNVHGTLTMRLRNSNTGEVGLFRDNNGFFDTYDFNGDGRVVRDVTTWGARRIVGEGTGFGFIPYGSNPKVPVKK